MTRNADLTLEEDEADDLLVALEVELRRRRFGEALRVEIQSGMSPEFLELLVDQLDLDRSNVYVTDAPLGLHDLWSLYAIDRPDLKGEGWSPITPRRLLDGEHVGDIFAAIREDDILLHHPYESFTDSVEMFIAQAATDPKVVGIKMTLYRTSGDSPIVASLIHAAEQGKQVAALVELKARFDEAANIEWAKALEDVGVHVVYGIVGLKTHSKTALVLRSEGDTTARYVHIATGNYNGKTARTYEDFGLLTCDPAITDDVGELFNFLTGFSRIGQYKKIMVSPLSTRTRVIELINLQRDRGPAGRISMKVNGLTDPDDHRRPLRGEFGRGRDPSRGPHALFTATRRRGTLGEHHRAQPGRRVLGALADLHLRHARGAGVLHLARLGRPHGTQPRPPGRGPGADRESHPSARAPRSLRGHVARRPLHVGARHRSPVASSAAGE